MKYLLIALLLTSCATRKPIVIVEEVTINEIEYAREVREWQRTQN
jgi:hypothetical protein